MNAYSIVCALFVSAAVSTAAAQTEVEHLYGSALWTEKTAEVTGAYTIERHDDELVLRLSDDFSTKKAPDLKIVLSPLSIKEANKKNALEGGLVLGNLVSHEGAQSFVIPTGTDFEKFRSVLIHCEKYTKLWAAAPLSAGELLAHGSSWTKKAQKVKGSYEIVRDGDRVVLRLGDRFKTKKAPDLKLVLSPHSVKDASAKNALDGGLVIAPLRSAKGAQEYEFPEGVDLEAYESLLIHCEQYTKLWGAVALR